MTIKLGSLFDGSGGFPLAGAMCGIEPVWAAEVEPYPIAVTTSRFPNMKHLGDISKVNGADIEPVDIITFGSPCQDLSVAGLRKGLKHEVNGDEETTRSGLFMEAVRIIKEMRAATNGEYPKVCLWENVPGAFSSNKGEDFRIVCEELIKIIEPSASMPSVPQKGWAYADSYCGDRWSLAYRVFDAQYWGVPQRRRRIHLCISFVANTGASSAREILFERQGLRGYFAEGRAPWQAVAPNAEGGSLADDREGGSTGGREEGAARDCGDGRGRLDAMSLNWQAAAGAGLCVEEELTMPLGCTRTPAVMVSVEGRTPKDALAYTMVVRSGCDADSSGRSAGKGALVQTERASTLNTVQDQYLFQPTVDSHILDDQGGQQVNVRTDGKSPTLRAEMHGNVPAVMEPTLMDAYQHHGWRESGTAGALTRDGAHHVRGDTPLVCVPLADQATRFAGKRGDKADGKGNGLGVGADGDSIFTLTGGDRHAVAYETPIALDRASYNQGANAQYKPQFIQDGTVPTLIAKGPGAVAHVDVAGVDCRNADETPELNGTLQAKPNGGFSPNYNQVVRVRYIVRRLTPTECARLQGFADWWGHIEPKHSLTDEEHRFWMDVRNTHAAINGKAVKEYNKTQMLTWYNKLWSDGAEYKMWGNGIALPPALYCMQGIADVLNREEDDDSWLM